MLKNYLSKFEDPRAPLLGPNIKCLKFVGLLLPESMKWRIIYIILHAFQSLFVITQYIDVWYIKSDKSLLYNNLKTTMLGTVNMAKALSFLAWSKYWKDILDYVTKADLEQRLSNDKVNHRIISHTTSYCRKVTYINWSLEILTCLFVIVSPILKYILSPMYRENIRNGDEDYLAVVNSWVPWDKRTLAGYIFASAYQIFAALMAVAWLSGYDATAIVIMVFFKGEMKLLRQDSSKIFGSEGEPVGVEEAKRRLKSCWWLEAVHRKDLILLMMQYKKTVVFSAGPFVELVMPTFISVRKLSHGESLVAVLLDFWREVHGALLAVS
ncbi:hypothetical protein MSG28_012573 [Choristoneura fumiferana]|uniref:Uncharacterized protein n=1 Tax=Choristoneura fumiferana TaxID=7141 RepID=A0ACC0JH18_CHOFU|nr:hypothetical protein MSG28_012573 [Choristoneura fumiferana]